jgi:type III secretory pathway component EscV
MDKKIINEEQFKKLVIKEAKKIFSEDKKSIPAVEVKTESKRLSIDEVDNLIKEMEEMNTSITSLSLSILDESENVSEKTIEESKGGPDRTLDVIEHNRKKNINHVNENEKDRIKRMLNYNVPKDEDR